ncbi:MAG: hypothetical protein LBP28_05720 [Coriobacteriales bacterium]|jgi:hypothetical protein|nr:hypothetical protein [Coriobacteriales bacterium]
MKWLKRLGIVVLNIPLVYHTVDIYHTGWLVLALTGASLAAMAIDVWLIGQWMTKREGSR